jgi:hypothetical protein
MKALLATFVFLPFLAFSQKGDTTLSYTLAKGKFSAHARPFFMATVNQGKLTDYYAWATGAGIGYESPEINHFKLGISGFFIYNLTSSDLSKLDPITNTPNRYEIGLFDITDPDNHRDLDRLEELFIQYRIHRSFLRAGKVILNTPFINPQDGRMRPTLEQGIILEMNEIKNLKIESAFINKISPRSTVKWYSIGESIGIYPQGFSDTGIRSDYAGYVNSDGIYLLGISYRQQTEISFWITLIDNISNTAFLQLERSFSEKHFYAGIQYVRQDAVGEGGNRDEAHQYINPDIYSNIFSARMGHKRNNIDVNLNGTVINGNGRYLMPREWGRDPFYTFLPRERIEGAGNVKAVSMNITHTLPGKRLRSSLGIGHYNLPDVRHYAQNKYAMPSFSQLNAEIRYNFGGYLQGTTAQLLYTYKLCTGRDYENPRNIINKVDMANVNLVLNYKFENLHTLPEKNSKH